MGQSCWCAWAPRRSSPSRPRRLRDAATPPQYEAHVDIGWDPERKQYVAHWLDVFGGSFSETLGYALMEAGALRFLFQYPDGPFRTTFLFGKAGWELDMKSRTKDGKWARFAQYVAQR